MDNFCCELDILLRCSPILFDSSRRHLLSARSICGFVGTCSCTIYVDTAHYHHCYFPTLQFAVIARACASFNNRCLRNIGNHHLLGLAVSLHQCIFSIRNGIRRSTPSNFVIAPNAAVQHSEQRIRLAIFNDSWRDGRVGLLGTFLSPCLLSFCKVY